MNIYDPLKLFGKLPVSEEEIINRVKKGEDLRFVNLDIVRKQYRDIRDAFNYAKVYIAVKANSTKGMLDVLNEEGSSFEVATIGEVRNCLSIGIPSENIIFTHPDKDVLEISESYKNGINTFVSDSSEDLHLLAKHAPGSNVIVRIINHNEGNGTDFNERFGVTDAVAKDLLKLAKKLKLNPYGISFHVGTQSESYNDWKNTLKVTASIFKDMKKDNIDLHLLNIGGGFPSVYRPDIPNIFEYGKHIKGFIDELFADNMPKEIILEPGRYISALAGITIGRVMNKKKHREKDDVFLVTLSVGKFSAGLWGDFGIGAVFYSYNDKNKLLKIEGDYTKACLYGKACAEMDKIFVTEEFEYASIPKSLNTGDIVILSGTGSYTGQVASTYWCSISPPTDIIFDTKI